MNITNKEIAQNNKIIAEFMGVSKSKIDANGQVLNFENSKYNTYNSDWNWLMEVVEKIENLPSRTLQGINYLGNEVKIYKAINTNTHYCEINLVKEYY